MIEIEECPEFINSKFMNAGKPSNKDGYKIDPSQISLMHASSQEFSTASWIQRCASFKIKLRSSQSIHVLVKM
jgi:hypothetical protein